MYRKGDRVPNRPVPRALPARVETIAELIARSSLGTPGAEALRRRTDRDALDRVLRRSDALSRGDFTGGCIPARDNGPRWASGEPHGGPTWPDHGEVPIVLKPGEFLVDHVRPIGSGGLGTVDEVVVVATNRSHPIGTRLARKRLGDQWSADPGARTRFEREIEMLRTMSHSHIVSLEGVSLPGGQRWYVMPLYACSVRARLQGGAAFADIEHVARFGWLLADALAHAHAKNFIHRDLKPENVLLDEKDTPVIADWGLGQFIHQHSKVLDLTCGGPLGTGYYCSIEQWATGRCDVTGDVYSLGVMLAEFAAGPVPITPIGAGIRQDVASNASPQGRAFNGLVRKMTSVVASSRHSSMGEVSLALQEVIAASAR